MRVDHVGSLLRPGVVAKQEARGLPVVSDGEYRRLDWQVSFSEVRG